MEQEKQITNCEDKNDSVFHLIKHVAQFLKKVPTVDFFCTY